MEKGARPTLAEANESLKNVLRERRAMGAEIKSIDDEIRALKVKRSRIILQEVELFEGPWEVAVQSTSKAWIQRTFQHMQHTIPREIRDMIYAYLWDPEILHELRVVMSMGSEGFNPDFSKVRPFYMDPKAVGQELALEVAESWYKAASQRAEEVFTIYSPERLEYFICGDPFLLDLNSSVAIRGLLIMVPIEELALPESTSESWLHRYSEILLKTKRKSGFKLTIKLKQKRIRLKAWSQALDNLRDMVEVFEKENATVRVCFLYDHDLVYPPFEYNLLGAIRDPDSDWKAEAIVNLDGEDHIRERHRLYRDENKPDFDPYNDDYFTTTESDFDDVEGYDHGLDHWPFGTGDESDGDDVYDGYDGWYSDLYDDMY